MTASLSSDNSFIGIDVGSTSFEAAWHRGGCAQYANRPDAIAAFLARLRAEPGIQRIVIEPTGGYEKLLVTALRRAELPVEMVHTSRFRAYRQLIGVRAKSDSSDARLLAAYAAAPDEIRRQDNRVVLPEDADREELAALGVRRDQLNRMIHAESCRLANVRSTLVRQGISRHLEALRQEVREIGVAMKAIVRQRQDLSRQKRLLRTIVGIGEVTAVMCLARAPELGRISNKAAAALIGVAPFVHESGGLSAPARIFGGRADVRRVFYMAAVTASQHNPVLATFYEQLIAAGKPPKVALIAVMRRLVVFANGVLRSDEPWKRGMAS